MQIATESNTVILEDVQEETETEALIETDLTSSADYTVALTADFQIELFLVLGIIIGILLVGDRRF